MTLHYRKMKWEFIQCTIIKLASDSEKHVSEEKFKQTINRCVLMGFQFWPGQNI